jgi:excisionase family DNA binding protein
VPTRLAVSKVTVYRLARFGELASVRIGAQVRFRPEAIETCIERSETRHNEPAPKGPSPRPAAPVNNGRLILPRRSGDIERRTWASNRVAWRVHGRHATGRQQSGTFDTAAEADASASTW